MGRVAVPGGCPGLGELFGPALLHEKLVAGLGLLGPLFMYR